MAEQHTTFKYDVFLSYSSKDKPRVTRLAERLRAAGFNVWFDHWSVRPGEDITISIEKGLQDSRVQILCFSPFALESDWVSTEWRTVLARDPSNRTDRFVPLLLTRCELPIILACKI